MSELGQFSHVHMQKLLFLSYFVGTPDTLSVKITLSSDICQQISKCTEKKKKNIMGEHSKRSDFISGSTGQSQFRNERNDRRGKADDEISVVLSFMRERALQRHIHFCVSKAALNFCMDSYSCHKLATAFL